MIPALLIGLVAAIEPPAVWKIGSPDWATESASVGRAELYKNYFDEALREQGFEVVAPADLGKELPQCGTDATCLAQLGRELEVKGVLAGKMRGFEDGSTEVQLIIVASDDARIVARTEAGGLEEDEMLRSLDEAAIALKTAVEVEGETPPPVATATIRQQQIARVATPPGPPGPPSAFFPDLNALPSMSVVALDEPVNAWIPAASGGLFAMLGGRAVLQSRDRQIAERRASLIGPLVEQTDYLAHANAVDPRRQELAGWGGVGFGVAAIAGAALLYGLEGEAPFTVEPFAGPTGGGMGLSTRW